MELDKCITKTNIDVIVMIIDEPQLWKGVISSSCGMQYGNVWTGGKVMHNYKAAYNRLYLNCKYTWNKEARDS